jgi:hypothetical protein
MCYVCHPSHHYSPKPVAFKPSSQVLRISALLGGGGVARIAQRVLCALPGASESIVGGHRRALAGVLERIIGGHCRALAGVPESIDGGHRRTLVGVPESIVESVGELC